MKRNMSQADRVIRALIAIVIGVLYLTHVISGTTAIVLGTLAVVFLLTSFMSFCPLYLLFGINTSKQNEK